MHLKQLKNNSQYAYREDDASLEAQPVFNVVNSNIKRKKGFTPVENKRSYFIGWFRLHGKSFKHRKKQCVNSLTGFTLIETLVAISIVTIGLMAPMTAVSLAIKSAGISKDRITAFYLAQEGIEFIRYTRDTNLLNSEPWLDNLFFCTNGTPCDIIDVLENFPTQNDFKNCSTDTSCVVKYDETTSLYGNGLGGDDTRFTREIEIDVILFKAEVEFEADITATISWTARDENHSVVLKDSMFNWSGN